MDTKLTLRLDKDIIEKIKIFASKHNKSLSDLTEDLYKTYLINESETKITITTPIANKYKGIIENSDFNYDKLKYSYLTEKHVK